MKIYSIKNEKLEFFNRPIYCESENEALSYIQNVLMSDADRALLSLKDDLALYELGEIDFVTGSIEPAGSSWHVDSGYTTYPIKVCSLREIFDTIPEERLKPSVTRDDISRLYEEIEMLKESLHNGATNFEKHYHNKKGDVII